MHVYVNLVQIPVLVLSGSLRPIPHLPDSSFKVTIDGLGQIHPQRIRMEGEDPINLVLIVDRSLKDDTLWNDLPKSLEPLIQSLRPRDHIGILGMDGCVARRFGPEMAPFDPDWLRGTAKTVTDMVPSKDRGKKATCAKPTTYWELVMYAASKLSQYPGRKILVTLGPGDKLPPELTQQVHSLLTGNSITMFPIVHPNAMNINIPYALGRPTRSGNQTQVLAMMNPRVDTDALQAMTTQAELSGGTLLGASFQDFAKILAQPVELARGRYIIEFPRPDKLPPGTHYIFVEDGHPRDFIRPAGISVPIAAPNEMRDASVEHGTRMEAQASAADSGMTPQDSGAAKPPETSAPQHPAATGAFAPPPPAAPAASPAPVTSAAAPAPEVTKPVAPKPPPPDPTDITDDLQAPR
ncbi:hypothetical protein [Terriglobus roseus]|uniref:hypothetical protein n=1 Tax=Terriglobus roseus TaxID=392734 RepID=UPI0009F5C272|nr:hypothetical protein [Terriglobus roseus]